MGVLIRGGMEEGWLGARLIGLGDFEVRRLARILSVGCISAGVALEIGVFTRRVVL